MYTALGGTRPATVESLQQTALRDCPDCSTEQVFPQCPASCREKFLPFQITGCKMIKQQQRVMYLHPAAVVVAEKLSAKDRGSQGQMSSRKEKIMRGNCSPLLARLCRCLPEEQGLCTAPTQVFLGRRGPHQHLWPESQSTAACKVL